MMVAVTMIGRNVRLTTHNAKKMRGDEFYS